MFAVIVNSLAIIVGTFIGLVFKKLINKEITQSILKVLGVVVIITGLIGVFKSMIIIEEGIIQSQLDLFLLIVVVVGIFIGEILKIDVRSEEHTSELQSRPHLVCRLLLEKKKNKNIKNR